jgi:hypothetical protein
VCLPPTESWGFIAIGKYISEASFLKISKPPYMIVRRKIERKVIQGKIKGI